MSKAKPESSVPDPKDKRIAELEAELAQARATIGRLQQQLERLLKEMDALKRSGKRQATPFARRQRVAAPQRPGRRTGQGTFGRRAEPRPDQVAETQVAELCACPQCGGVLAAIREHEQYVTDIPVVQPVTTRYVTYSGYCAACRRRVRSRHPDQISTATGAAGVLVGPRAKALAAELKHGLGASYAKVSAVLSTAFGLPVTRSGWCQADRRLATQARPHYEELVKVMQQCSVVHVDETGWRIGTLSAWLWVFTNQHATVYKIAQGRGHEVVVDILGREFKGVLVSDCFTAYDHRALAAWLKQKCLAHLLRELDELDATKTRGAVRFARDLTALLRAALQLKTAKAHLDDATFQQRAAALETQLDTLIAAKRKLTDPDNQRLAKRLRKHRPHLLRFLYHDGLDATNNQAERMLRPAVITRKTNGCNRTDDGAETHAILSSVLATCRQRDIPVLDYLIQLQQSGALPNALVPP